MEKLTKKIVRERIAKLLRAQKEEERLAKSAVILDKLFRMREFKKASKIFFYASFDGEVETFEMIRQAQKLGKKIALPQILKVHNRIIPILIEHLGSDLEDGPYGVKQPKGSLKEALAVDSMDMVIVPGIAFDRRNNRLGRGKGYYDRFLGMVPPHVPTIGLAFDFQILDSLPQQEHDVAVSHVLVN